VQSQQLPTESQVLEDEVLPGTENADQPTEEMSKRHDHGKNCSGKIRIELCAKSFILQVYDVVARHNSLATFFGSNDVHPSVIQTMLRHSKQQTTLRYIHAVNDKQVEAQGLYLDAIKIGGKQT